MERRHRPTATATFLLGDDAGHRGQQIAAHGAPGNGGNKFHVIASRRMAASIASGAYGKAHGQRRSKTILHAVGTQM